MNNLCQCCFWPFVFRGLHACRVPVCLADHRSCMSDPACVHTCRRIQRQATCLCLTAWMEAKPNLPCRAGCPSPIPWRLTADPFGVLPSAPSVTPASCSLRLWPPRYAALYLYHPFAGTQTVSPHKWYYYVRLEICLCKGGTLNSLAICCSLRSLCTKLAEVCLRPLSDQALSLRTIIFW